MRYTTAIAIGFSAAATLVAAQTTSTCEAQNILDTCVTSYQSRIKGCTLNGNDFICLCDAYKDLLICYNNCPNDSNKSTVENQVSAYCVAADPLRSASMSARLSLESVAATATTAKPASTAASTTAGGSNAAGSSVSPAATAFNTNAANSFGAPAGAALVAFFGAVGLL